MSTMPMPAPVRNDWIHSWMKLKKIKAPMSRMIPRTMHRITRPIVTGSSRPAANTLANIYVSLCVILGPPRPRGWRETEIGLAEVGGFQGFEVGLVHRADDDAVGLDLHAADPLARLDHHAFGDGVDAAAFEIHHAGVAQ